MAGADLTPIYYLASIAGTAGAGVMGARAYLSRQRDRWVAEGTKQASLSDSLVANTAAAAANTAAIERLSRDLHDYTSKTETQLNGHAGRLDRMESIVLSRQWGAPGGS